MQFYVTAYAAGKRRSGHLRWELRQRTTWECIEPVATIAWDRTAADRLSSAIELHRHTQEECAARLRELGAAAGTHQSAVCNWRLGHRTPQASSRRAILSYIEEAEAERQASTSADVDDASDEDRFQESVRSMTNEPLFGPLQQAFIEAQITRLRDGPEMSAHDESARIDVMRLLRLTP